MQDTDPNEFTDREKFILSYYRDRDLSAARGMTVYDIIVVAASIVCLILAAVREDAALGFVAYALVLGRLSYIVVEGGKWSGDFQSIFRKYDAKLKAATEAQKPE
ncbi:MAG: hypothetical protein ACO1QS_06820 [Verrucomicrobiota bacterium]